MTLPERDRRLESNEAGDGSAPPPDHEWQAGPGAPNWLGRWREIDWPVVRCLFGRDAFLTVRSRRFYRLLAWWAAGSCFLALLPALYRTAPGHWLRPTGQEWLLGWAAATCFGALAAVSGWTRQRLSRELRAGSLDEVLLTGSSPADILLARVLGAACLAALLALAALPACIWHRRRRENPGSPYSGSSPAWHWAVTSGCAWAWKRPSGAAGACFPPSCGCCSTRRSSRASVPGWRAGAARGTPAA